MSSPIPFEQALPARSVQEEYQVVHQTACPCGGVFAVGGPSAGVKQELVRDERTGKPYDLLHAACLKCGTKRDFLFDISSFFGARTDGGEPRLLGVPPGAPSPVGHSSAGGAPAAPNSGGCRNQMAMSAVSLALLCAVACIYHLFQAHYDLGGGFAVAAVVLAVLAYFLYRPAPAPASTLPAPDGSAAEMDAVLRGLGLSLQGPADTPQSALVRGMAKASLVMAHRKMVAGDLDGALAAVNSLMDGLRSRADPACADLAAAAHYLRGQVYARRGEADKARADYQAALQLMPQHGPARQALQQLGG